MINIPENQNNISNDSDSQQINLKEKEEKGFMEKINSFASNLSRVPLKEKLFFVQHLGIMLKAGISLSKALKTLAIQTRNKRFAGVLLDLSQRVEKGNSFADSLRHHEKIFGELFTSMVDAGEMSGKLEEVLRELFVQMKKDNALISKVKGALTYPTVILLAMVGIGTFMMVFVIPKMLDMFKEMNAELPLPTKILIGISDFMSHNLVICALIVIGVIVAFVRVLKTHWGKYYFQAFLLKTPIFGSIIKKINLARFARTISSLLQTDIMIIKSFQITANVVGNLHYRVALLEMAQRIKKGGKLNEVIQEYPNLFPPVVAQMVAVGEDTGELDSILVELADFYENEVDQIMENLPSIIEPLLILVLGLGVGGIAIAIVMPMYSITQSIN